MSNRPGPAIRLQLARALAGVRDRAGLSQSQLADAAGLSKTTVVRYETWRDPSGVNPRTVGDLARACGATAEEIDAMVQLLRTTTAPGWWSGDSVIPAWMNPLLAFEAWAQIEHVYANSLIHGLLQTRDYALAVHHAAALRLAPEEIDRMVDARMRRQEILDRQPEFRLWVVLDEAVLHRAVGGPQVMAAQIEHLMDLAQRPTIDIQVLPLGAGATAAGTGHFVILGRGTPMTTGIVYIELQQDGLYLDRQEQLGGYTLTFDHLRAQAASSRDSLRLMDAIRQEHRR